MSRRKSQLANLAEIDPLAFYTVEEVAPLLRTSPRTLRRYCTEGLFSNATKIGGKIWLIPGCDVIRLCPHLPTPQLSSASPPRSNA